MVPRVLKAVRAVPRVGLAAYAMVASACLFGLVTLRAERLAAPNLNDGVVHAQMVRYIDRKISLGEWPLTGWYPFYGLGYPLLQHYQAAPAFLTALLGHVIGDNTAHAWTLYLLLSLWPIVVYAAARLFELDRLTSACAALLSPMLTSAISLGYEHGAYVWQGFGVWTQLFGMWALPLSWALTWRAVSRGGSLLLASLALTATVTLHFLTGYQALAAMGIWVLMGAPSGLLRRAVRAAVVGVVALLASAWVLVPLMSDGVYAATSATNKSSVDFNSYGATKILSWLIHGDVYDFGRAPVITVLAAVGVVVCVARWRKLPAAMALLGITIFAFLLWFGKPFWGSVLRLLPGASSLYFSRFIMGVHLAGILLAGIGLAALVRGMHHLASWVWTHVPERIPGRVVVPVLLGSCVLLLFLVPAGRSVQRYDESGRDQINYEMLMDATSGAQVRQLATEATAHGGGRIYAGSRNGWGQQYKVGQVPVYALLNDDDREAPGFTGRASSLSNGVESMLDPSDPRQLRLLGIRWLIYPQTQPPPAGAVLVRALGPHRLYELPGPLGLISIGEIDGTVVADNMTVGSATRAFVLSGRADKGSYDAVAFAGQAPLPLTTHGTGPPGTVTAEVDKGEEGTYQAAVSMQRASVAVLKASYHGGWKAYVDGKAVPVGMVAPSFVGVPVPAGQHTLEFRFESQDHHLALILLGLLALIALGVLERRWGGSRGRRASAAAGHDPPTEESDEPEEPDVSDEPGEPEEPEPLVIASLPSPDGP